MGAVVQLRVSGRGRQPAAVEALRDQRDELFALTAEGIELAARLVALSRRAQGRVARGIYVADVLEDLEQLGLRHGIQMTAAAAAMCADEVCPDGAEQRRAGHGRAA